MNRILLCLMLGLLYSCGANHIYINETDSKSHDLAIKASLKMAMTRAETEIVLVRLPTLSSSQKITEYAVEQFKNLEVGKKYKSRGVLIVVVDDLKQIKIEVSKNLEGVLTDFQVGRLEKAAEAYFFSKVQQDYYSELVITIANVLTGKPTEDFFGGISGGAGVKSSVDDLDYEPAVLKSYIPELDPEQAAKLYIQSLREGISSSELEILTPGSKIFRKIVPRNPAQLRRMADYYSESHKSRFFKTDKEAILAFVPGSHTLPVYMVKSEDGFWLIDEPKMWSYYHRFEDSPGFRVMTSDTPFKKELFQSDLQIHPCSIYKDRFSVITNSKGDDFFFNQGNLPEAKKAYEAEASAAKDSSSRWKLVHVLMNLSLMDEALEQFYRLEDENPEDKELMEWSYFYHKEYLGIEKDFETSALKRSLIFLKQRWLELRHTWKNFFMRDSGQRPC